MARSLQRAKGRRESGAFIALPFSVLQHPNFVNLSAKGRSLLLEFCNQLCMKEGGPINNGDLCATPATLRDRGWSSNEVLEFAIKELLHYGFIIITRRGDRKRCHLYAITFFAINECDGKLDVDATRTPLNDWKNTKTKWTRPKRKDKVTARKLKSVPRFP